MRTGFLVQAEIGILLLDFLFGSITHDIVAFVGGVLASVQVADHITRLVPVRVDGGMT